MRTLEIIDQVAGPSGVPLQDVLFKSLFRYRGVLYYLTRDIDDIRCIGCLNLETGRLEYYHRDLMVEPVTSATLTVT